MEDFSGLWFDCENVKTSTSQDQCTCEKECATFLKPFTTYTAETLEKLRNGELVNYDKEIRLLRSMHSIYLVNGLNTLPAGFISLDASRPWICYWILHALYLLDKEPKYLYPRIISTLSHMQNKTGGFGGGPSQLSQGAPNYAAVLALCIVGTKEALSVIDRPAMYNYFLSMKHPCGGFTIHHDGEVDSRSTYTVISVARILGLLTPELIAGVADFLVRCQTYEGGFGGEPGNEAHGGYNFCALAALVILGETGRCDMDAQEHWLLNRQVKLEGGFQGRTNKLVDSCYSFWQGAALAMVEMVRHSGSDIYDLQQYMAYTAGSSDSVKNTGDGMAAAKVASTGSSSSSAMDMSPGDAHQEGAGEEEMDLSEALPVRHVRDTDGCLGFNQKALQRYVLHCAQNLDGGGMRDKPGKSRDFYHSCYALSGLSISQCCIVAAVRDPSAGPVKMEGSANKGDGVMDDDDEEDEDVLPGIEYDWSGAQVFGDYANLLAPTSAVFNIGLKKLQFALDYFRDADRTHEGLMRAYREGVEMQRHK